MDSFFRFRDFPVYQEIRQFRKDLKKLSKEKFPKEENYITLDENIRKRAYKAVTRMLKY